MLCWCEQGNPLEGLEIKVAQLRATLQRCVRKWECSSLPCYLCGRWKWVVIVTPDPFSAFDLVDRIGRGNPAFGGSKLIPAVSPYFPLPPPPHNQIVMKLCIRNTPEQTPTNVRVCICIPTIVVGQRLGKVYLPLSLLGNGPINIFLRQLLHTIEKL
jgi:hypothetical protein